MYEMLRHITGVNDILITCFITTFIHLCKQWTEEIWDKTARTVKEKSKGTNQKVRRVQTQKDTGISLFSPEDNIFSNISPSSPFEDKEQRSFSPLKE